MSNLKTHAERELRAAGYYDPESDYGGLIPAAVLELIDVFSKQGHSGMSASLVRSIFGKLADFKPLTGIKGTEDEWNDVGSAFGGKEVYQNNRLSALFKDGAEGKPYYLDAVVFQGEEAYDRFTGTVEEITSRQYVKSFPFLPRTLIVDVVRDYAFGEPEDKSKYYEDQRADGEKRYYQYVIKDRNQLNEVFGYYDQFNKEEVVPVPEEVKIPSRDSKKSHE